MHATSPTDPRPQSWIHYVLPSVSDLIFLVLLISLSVGVLAPRILSDAGTGWHIRNGQLILATHSITRADPFSSTMQGKPWYAWEWLYDVVIAALHGVSGLNGVVFFSAFVIAITFALTFRFALARGGNLAATVLLLLLAMSAATIHFFARPHVFSWLFVVLWLHLLDSSETNPAGGRRLIWLPVLMLLWVNVHGGFLTGFVLLACYFLGNLGQYFRSRNPGEREVTGKRLRRLGTVGLLSLVASLLNPYGYRLYVHIYQYLSDRFLMDHIDEFLAPNFHGIAQQCFAVLVLITLMVLALARTKPRLVDLLIMMLAVASGLYSARNLPVSSILLTLTVSPLWGNSFTASDDPGSRPSRELRGLIFYLRSLVFRMNLMDKQLRGHLWPLIALLAGTWICAHGGKLGANQILAAKFSEKRFPVQAAEVITQRRIPGPIFCPDHWGGYLIYRFYPVVKVVVDDRHDLYGEQFFKNYLKLVKLEPGWDEVLTKNNVDWVLMPAESPLAGALSERKDWSVEYRDDVEVLLHRKSGL